jgi:hypothetical protein
MRSSNLRLAGLGCAAMAASFCITLAALAASATTAPWIEPVDVNRVLKGDRDPLMGSPRSASPTVPAHEPNLPEGCMARFDARKSIFQAEVAGRCVV